LNQSIPDQGNHHKHDQRNIQADKHPVLLIQRLSLSLKDFVRIHIDIPTWN
jgi:hypothetical protein